MSDLIRRQDAIEAFADMREGYPVVHGDMLSDADVVAILHDLSSAQSKTEWIPVSERLPKTGGSVLVTYSDGEVGIIWSARPKKWVKYIRTNLIHPIAWMPLPKPYKGGGE